MHLVKKVVESKYLIYGIISGIICVDIVIMFLGILLGIIGFSGAGTFGNGIAGGCVCGVCGLGGIQFPNTLGCCVTGGLFVLLGLMLFFGILTMFIAGFHKYRITLPEQLAGDNNDAMASSAGNSTDDRNSTKVGSVVDNN